MVALFCLLIAIACFSAKLLDPALRGIGVMVFAAGVAYLIYELRYEPHKQYAGRSEPHWLNAIFFLFCFGFPGLGIATSGLFRRKKSRPSKETTETNALAESAANPPH